MPRISITVPGMNAQPYRFELDRPVVTLGRGSENDVVIDSGSVSGVHAEMRRVKTGYELVDVGSTNGIKLHEHRYQVIPLENHMTAHIGDVAFYFSLSDDELQAIAYENRVVEPLPPVSPPFTEAQIPPVRQVPQRKSYTPVKQSGGGGGMVFLFLLLAIGAFFAGLSVRFNKETGGNLYEVLRQKYLPEKAPVATPTAVPATPAAETPAPAEAPAADQMGQ